MFQEEILNQHMENAKKRRAAEEAAATPDERVALYASKKSEALALRKQEVSRCDESSLCLGVPPAPSLVSKCHKLYLTKYTSLAMGYSQCN